MANPFLVIEAKHTEVNAHTLLTNSHLGVNSFFMA
jgi:hypothetical protein